MDERGERAKPGQGSGKGREQKPSVKSDDLGVVVLRMKWHLIADVDPLAQVRVPLRAGSGAADGATQTGASYPYGAAANGAAATNGTAAANGAGTDWS
jgi:hypothetical protein